MIIRTVFNLLKNEVIFRLGIRRTPISLQMPITSKCNSRCLTCNIWKYKERTDLDVSKLSSILANKYFAKVQNVGLNGGEPTLHADFVELVKAILKLPSLKNIFIISNSINSSRLLEQLRSVYPLCKERGVKLNLQISLDGIGGVHDEVRGIKNSFSRTMNTIDTLRQHKDEYLDNFNLGCTISRYNVDYLPEIEEYFESYNVPFYFHLAVPNKRIHNFDDAPFSVMADEHAKQMAAEFFWKRYENAKNRNESCRAFLIYLYLIGKSKKRLFECDYLYRDVTINESLDTFLCATASDKAGNLVDDIPSKKLYSRLESSTKAHCDTCIHYANEPNLRGILTFLFYKIKYYKWTSVYKQLSKML